MLLRKYRNIICIQNHNHGIRNLKEGDKGRVFKVNGSYALATVNRQTVWINFYDASNFWRIDFEAELRAKGIEESYIKKTSLLSLSHKRIVIDRLFEHERVESTDFIDEIQTLIASLVMKQALY